jgi:stage II sporulation protein GA (sporulation sigma-E factor processing peptidase)
MNVIYIDLLVIINLYITFFLLKATGGLLHRAIPGRRLFAGSIAGGVSSLMILLPALPFLLNSAARIATGMVIVLITFGFRSRSEYLKNALFFVIINVIFAGLTMLLWLFAAPLSMEYNNGYVYLDISFVALIITTSAAYGLIRLLRYILDVRGAAEREYTAEIVLNCGKSLTLPAIADSGNKLTDYFTGLSVIVISMPENHGENFGDFPRFLPYNTIDSHGLIPAYKVKAVIIRSSGKPDKHVKALVGIATSNENSPAIFNPRLLI